MENIYNRMFKEAYHVDKLIRNERKKENPNINYIDELKQYLKETRLYYCLRYNQPMALDCNFTDYKYYKEVE